MKFSLLPLVAATSLSLSSAFVVHPSSPPIAASRLVTSLDASKAAAKKLSRAKWAEKRAFGAEAGVTESDTAGTAGMMKNEAGLEYVKLVSSNGASAEVYLYGGVVTSYKDAEGTEFIAVRPDAKMDGSKPISGGLSHCWPQVSD